MMTNLSVLMEVALTRVTSATATKTAVMRQTNETASVRNNLFLSEVDDKSP